MSININELIVNAAKMLPLPSIDMRISTLFKDPDCTSARLAEAVAYDPGLTVRVLKVANAVYQSRRGGRIETLTQAITLIGMNNLQNLVLATSTAQLFKKMDNTVIDLEVFWKHSVSCALATRALAQRCYPKDCERSFVAGLLHDIGQVIISQQVPDIARRIWGGPTTRFGHQEYLQEQAELGFTHADVGAELLRSWDLSASLWEPIEYHHVPFKAQQYPIDTALLAIGSAIVDILDLENALFVPGEITLAIDKGVWDVCGLSPQVLDEVIPEIYEQYFTVSEVILQPTSH